MELIYYFLAFFVGVFCAAWTIAPMIIIITFGIPFTFEMKKIGVLVSLAPAKRYLISFVLLFAVCSSVSWVIYNFFPNQFFVYISGGFLAILFNLRRLGRNEDNASDFFRANKQFLNKNELGRYLAGRQSIKNSE